MFEGFTRTGIATSGARIHLRHGGDGPPLLLLHGNPLTHVSWHKIANRLAERLHVVAADLRGYGDSIGPEDGGENNINYSFRAMAQDQIEVMAKPGIGLGFFDPEAFAEYVRCFNWKTIKGSCADYRACPTCDFDMDKADFEAGRKITVPLLVIWGARSHTEGVHGDVLAVWQRGYASDAWGGALPCGHYVPEEAPEETLKWLLQHFEQ